MYPHERSLVKKYSDAPFALIGVNSDREIARVKTAIEKNNITWRSFWQGAAGTGGPISTRWNVRGWPTVVFIDHKGVIRFRGHHVDDKLLERLIEEARTDQADKK